MKATILSLEVVSQFGDSRIMVTTDADFENFDKNKIKVKTNTFGCSQKHLFSVVTANKVYNLMKAMRVGRNVKPEYLGLLFTNAEIEFSVKLQKAGTVVRGIKLESDAYVTTIEKIMFHVDKDFETLLMQERKDWFTTQSTQNVVVNPFT